MTFNQKGEDIMNYEIEKNVPLRGRGKYPFNEMEVGDSFFVPSPFHNKARQAALARNGKRYRKRSGKPQRFITRTVNTVVKGNDINRNYGEGGIRIWRVE